MAISACQVRRSLDTGAEESRPKTSQKCEISRSLTSSRPTGRPSSRSSEVTPRSASPHGTMRLKQSRSVLTFRAKPWLVTQRAMLASHPGAGQTRQAVRRNPIVGGGQDEDLLEIAHVAVHVTAVGLEIEDRISHDLAGTVVGDVAAPAGFVDVDPPLRQLVGARQNMTAPAVAADAEREHGRVLEKEQHVVDAIVLAVLDEGTLKRQPLRVGHYAEPADVEPARDGRSRC